MLAGPKLRIKGLLSLGLGLFDGRPHALIHTDGGTGRTGSWKT